uniref:Putative iron-sulfur binding domain containing protein n=1 Tax=viral metagenome TaxID=1070528 RepID=A0A6M3L1Z2_9ZZZZ
MKQNPAGQKLGMINEIFQSINGEVNWCNQGSIATFIRFSGCNLSCPYCDTTYAQNLIGFVYQFFSHDLACRVLEKHRGVENITITGGEPLLQKEFLIDFLCCLLQKTIVKVSIETNGTIPIPELDRDIRCIVGWVIDFKLPSSGAYNEKNLQNLPNDVTDNDWIKFVIGDREDYLVAKNILNKCDYHYNLAFSPVLPGMTPSTLLGWMLEDHLFHVVLNVQIHKLINIK